ncbi:hypothetical protein IAU60_006741 [Kwoniella sp. DSM 27419]
MKHPSDVAGTSSRSPIDLFRSELTEAGLEAQVIPGRGRGLVTKKAFKPGNRIISVEPAASVLSTEYLTNTCSGCFLTPAEKTILQSPTTLRAEQFQAGLSEPNSDEEAKKLNRCSGCKALHYCSRECQVSDWPAHKTECTALKRLRKMYLKTYPSRAKDTGDVRWAGHEAIRAMARICWRRRDYRNKSGGQDGEWWNKMASLESHIKQLPEADVMRHAKQVQHLQHYLSAGVPLRPTDDADKLEPADLTDYGFQGIGEALALVSRFKVNSFTLSSPTLTPIGVSTSPLVALSNHSCVPNAVVVFPSGGKAMEVIAISDIASQEEILTAYIDVATPYSARQAELLDRYRFECECKLCQYRRQPQWVDPRHCVWHQGCQKGNRRGRGNMPDVDTSGSTISQCDLCGEKFAVDVPELRKMIQQGEGLLVKDRKGTLDPVEGLSITSALIPSLLTLCPPSAHPLLPIIRLSVLLGTPPTDNATLDILLSHISLSYTGSAMVYPPNHPSITIILCEWAKVLALGDLSPPARDASPEDVMKRSVHKLMMAIEMLRKAISACEKSFGGSGGVAGKDLRGLLQGCEGELELMRNGARPMMP